MMIAIHQECEMFGDRWSARWINGCDELKIPYKLVDCYSSSIINDVSGCTGVMWHWNQQDSKGALFARQLFASLYASGIKTFPDFGSIWHHDDKVGQKYLLEAIGAPLVRSYVFYDKAAALSWCKRASFPIVFKLRGGAGSVNVRLVRSETEAARLIDRAFGRGFAPIDRWARLKDRVWRLKRDRNLAGVRSVLGGIARVVIPSQAESGYPREKGYVYFQEFVPGNTYDTRLVVVGDRCFGLRRYNREGDFRASGSGMMDYDYKAINLNAVRVAFDVAKMLGSRSMSFDFLESPLGPVIVEVSYCYVMGRAYDDCTGYWNPALEWKRASVDPQRFILEDFVSSL